MKNCKSSHTNFFQLFRCLILNKVNILLPNSLTLKIFFFKLYSRNEFTQRKTNKDKLH